MRSWVQKGHFLVIRKNRRFPFIQHLIIVSNSSKWEDSPITRKKEHEDEFHLKNDNTRNGEGVKKALRHQSRDIDSTFGTWNFTPSQ